MLHSIIRDTHVAIKMCRSTYVACDTSVLPACILPDFICELHSCFYDQRSVWMHGHTRLSFNHKSTKRQRGSCFKDKFQPRSQVSNDLQLLSASHSLPSEHRDGSDIITVAKWRLRDAPESSLSVASGTLNSVSPLLKVSFLCDHINSCKKQSGQMYSGDLWHDVPLHQVSEQVHNLLLQDGPVLDDGVSFVGHLLLKLLQLLDLLTDLKLGLSQGCDPG